MKYQIPQTVFIQEIDDEIILLDTITQEYFSLNEVGKNIIDLISENLTKDEMVEELSNIYEVDRIQIEKDLINFAKLLEEKGLITIDYFLLKSSSILTISSSPVYSPTCASIKTTGILPSFSNL